MLDTLLEAEANEQIDETGIQEEVDTFMFEGYDTTSSGILYCLFMIATHSDYQHGIFQEILKISGKSLFENTLYSRYIAYLLKFDFRGK